MFGFLEFYFFIQKTAITKTTPVMVKSVDDDKVWLKTWLPLTNYCIKLYIFNSFIMYCLAWFFIVWFFQCFFYIYLSPEANFLNINWIVVFKNFLEAWIYLSILYILIFLSQKKNLLKTRKKNFFHHHFNILTCAFTQLTKLTHKIYCWVDNKNVINFRGKHTSKLLFISSSIAHTNRNIQNSVTFTFLSPMKFVFLSTVNHFK